MLDPAYSHIVLVHYREVSEGRFLPPPQPSSHNRNPNLNMVHRNQSSASEIYDSCYSTGTHISGEVNSNYLTEHLETDYLNYSKVSDSCDPSSNLEINEALREIEEQLSLDKYDDNSSVVLPDLCHDYDKVGNLAPQGTETGIDQSLVLHLGIDRKVSPSWNDMLNLSSSSIGNTAQERVSSPVALTVAFKPSCCTTWTNGTHQDMGNALEKQSDFEQFSSEDDIFDFPFDLPEQISLRQPGFLGNNAEHTANGRDFLWGAWFDQCQHETSLGAEPSLTFAQKQLFRFREISPEWSFSFERTKVMIIGDFLCDPSAYCWAVMFDNDEVPAEIVQQGVLRCQAPEHAAGRVKLCVTSGNGKSCSELREFEFRGKPSASTTKNLPQVKIPKSPEQLLLLVKCVHFLLCRSNDLSAFRGTDHMETKYHRKFEAAEEHWLQILEELQAGCEISPGTIYWIMEELLKDKLQRWLLFKMNSKEDGNGLLSKEEKGIIHMISAMGYEWALSQILDLGVGINFRDVNGWTALHWAARFGREDMVAALLAAGAFSVAVTDPTPQDPVGKTAGAIAAFNGHKGLAGYLSEFGLTSHLASLTMGESEISKGSAVAEAEKVVESILERSAQPQTGGTEDDQSFKDYLAAARNAAQAAARIQAAFRAHSFRKREEKAASSCDEYGKSLDDIYNLCVSSKLPRAAHGYRDLKFDKAALSIQKKYRGWKNRKDFLALRWKVVKIQAHVRGHQVRKKYREILWSVSVLEKVVLRWRRKSPGLRHFRRELEQDAETENDKEDIVKVFRKLKVNAAVEQALSRVLSMVESPKARQQYRRMLERYRNVMVEQLGSEELSELEANFEMMQYELFDLL
ncbi:hypothetical protein HPP92_023118 [Vanilla planifolia]|uniref:CG-1 domain-containing protein n=1 Tax=Vanilla planifolia TaxID=51239 RepID=A0A835UFY8_VANPL|nr:hypothetical protein HPP92_023118 [Vanilla planifolia]